MTATPIDTSEMPTIHTFFRREFRLAGGVVRRVADGDVRRATVVAEHLELVDRMPAPPPHRRGRTALAEAARAGARGAGADRAAHGGAARPGRRPARRDRRTPRGAGADARTPSTVSGWPTLFDQLYVHLAEHLDAEEERLLPDRRPRAHARPNGTRSASAPQETGGVRRWPDLGMFQYEGDPEVVARMLAEAPAPVRWLVPRLSRRAFRRHALRHPRHRDALTRRGAGQFRSGGQGPSVRAVQRGRPAACGAVRALGGCRGRGTVAVASASRASVWWTVPGRTPTGRLRRTGRRRARAARRRSPIAPRWRSGGQIRATQGARAVDEQVVADTGGCSVHGPSSRRASSGRPASTRARACRSRFGRVVSARLPQQRLALGQPALRPADRRPAGQADAHAGHGQRGLSPPAGDVVLGSGQVAVRLPEQRQCPSRRSAAPAGGGAARRAGGPAAGRSGPRRCGRARPGQRPAG